MIFWFYCIKSLLCNALETRFWICVDRRGGGVEQIRVLLYMILHTYAWLVHGEWYHSAVEVIFW